MTPRYIDAHCHLQFPEYDADQEEVIARMREEGVGAIVVGTDLDSSRAAVALVEEHDHLWATVGVHPNHVSGETFDVAAFHSFAAHPKVVGIGECGLDYFRGAAPEERERQQELFKQHIALASEFGKPLIIHARPSKGTVDAYEGALAILKEAKAKRPDLRGIAHFFAGGSSEAEAFVALGFSLSFTAVITFARQYDEVIRAAPLERLLAETDAPYVAPASRRGTRNDPLAVIDVVAQIAAVRAADSELVRATILANTLRFFSLQAV